MAAPSPLSPPAPAAPPLTPEAPSALHEDAKQQIASTLARLSTLLGFEVRGAASPDGQRFLVSMGKSPPVAITLGGLHPETVAADVARWLGLLADAVENRRVTHGPLLPPKGARTMRLGGQ
ncbi:MAG TPA: hypothetical protein VGI39_39185 [Polyangiaceae bacterium]|jgi:hypothetical protein